MASKRIWLLGLIAVVFAAVAVLVLSFAHHRGGLALQSQSVVSRYAVQVTDETFQRKVIEASLPASN